MVLQPPRPADHPAWLPALTAAAGGSDAARSGVLLDLADSFAATGRLTEARDLLGELLRTAPGPDAATRTAALAQHARMDRLLGNYAAAAALLAPELTGPDGVPAALAVEHGLACLLAGRAADARPALAAAATAAQVAADQQALAAVLAVHALLAAALGLPAAARCYTGECALLPEPGVATAARLGWTEVLLGRTDTAHRHFTAALAAIERGGHGVRAHLPYVLLGLGHLARTAGDLTAAAGLARHVQGIALHTGARDVMCLALTLEATAGAPSAAQLAEQAVTLAPPGDTWYGRVARSALRAIRTGNAALLPPGAAETDTALPPEPEPAGLHALTDRQREVAVLVGQGATSKAVARALRISPHTVDVHLARIYRALGVSSRAGLAALVARAEWA